MDHQGQTMIVSYEGWSFYVVANETTGELIGGYMPGVFDSVARLLNITVKYVKFSQKGAYGVLQSDGRYLGWTYNDPDPIPESCSLVGMERLVTLSMANMIPLELDWPSPRKGRVCWISLPL